MIPILNFLIEINKRFLIEFIIILFFLFIYHMKIQFEVSHRLL